MIEAYKINGCASAHTLIRHSGKHEISLTKPLPRKKDLERTYFIVPFMYEGKERQQKQRADTNENRTGSAPGAVEERAFNGAFCS